MPLFIVLGLLGVCFFIASLLFGDHDVGGHDHDFSHNHDTSSGHGTSVFSVFTISWFMIGFGGVGAIARLNSLSLPLSNFFGILAGSLGWCLAFGTMHLLYKQQADSTVTVTKLGNTTATVSLAIPTDGTGKIQCHVAGGINEYIARSAFGQSLREGTLVKVVSDSGGVYLVEPVAQNKGGRS
jgi:membrane-bound ClpP family serine protease